MLLHSCLHSYGCPFNRLQKGKKALQVQLVGCDFTPLWHVIGQFKTQVLDSSGRSLLLSVRTQSEKKSHSLSTHEWVTGKERMRTEMRDEQEEKTRATETEGEILSHSEATADNSRLWLCSLPFSLCLSLSVLPFSPSQAVSFSSCQAIFLSSTSIHPHFSIQGHMLMLFNTAGQPGSLLLRKWG
ncbi:uncharacterized protein LOC121891219 isoform X2 [Thunnus maccoyii]|uniref:uncharacterized protein LOC121891219 isoform X2 n=1 Tax=Thunnus maccoyii TaxID=8240 RepID=UPI001C4B92E9|nr:uncharacterized protein LOC121891219 isoform X2 [Thunnus maccoyii]